LADKRIVQPGRFNRKELVVKLKYALACVAAVLLSSEACAALRTFVATTGVDTNTSVNCGPTAPCRTFNAALSVTDAGGEVVVLNSGGYGPATITQSVSITAPDGVYAGVTVASGNTGFTITTPGVNVALKGLTITGSGVAASNGVVVAVIGAVTLTVENCVISNPSGTGIDFVGSGVLRVVDTLIRDSGWGVIVQGGSADIVHSRLFGNDYGISISLGATEPASTVVVTDSVVSGASQSAIYVAAQAASSNAQVSVVRSTLSNNQYGVYAEALTGAVVQVSVSDSLVTGNTTGIYQFQDATPGSSATLTSFGNNAFSGNATDEVGTITTTALK
jgi:hypothetical protein